MLKAATYNPGGVSLLLLGFTEKNFELLKAGHPIKFTGSSVCLPFIEDVNIFYAAMPAAAEEMSEAIREKRPVSRDLCLFFGEELMAALRGQKQVFVEFPCEADMLIIDLRYGQSIAQIADALQGGISKDTIVECPADLMPEVLKEKGFKPNDSYKNN